MNTANTEANRLRTFVYSLQRGELQVPSLTASHAGFRLAGPGETQQVQIECTICNLQLASLHQSHSPLTWHRILSPECPFLQDNAHHNATFLETSNISQSRSTQTLLQTVESASTHASDTPLTIQELPTPGTATQGQSDVTTDSSTALLEQYKKLNTLRLLVPEAHIQIIQMPSARTDVYPDECIESYRRTTFNDWPKEGIVSSASLAASGFIHIQGDLVECVYCKVRIGEWTEKENVDRRHITESPQCRFMQGSQRIKNIADVFGALLREQTAAESSMEISVELGIVIDAVAAPDFAIEERRKATFLTWPASNQKLASEMVEHFLYYTGSGDTVACFSCGVEMSGWTASENIWRRHARQSQRCQLVMEKKGADWVISVIEEHGVYRQPEPEQSINMVTTRMLRPRMDSPITQAVLRMTNPEYSREEIRDELIQHIKFGLPDHNSKTSLIKALVKRREERKEAERIRNSAETAPAPPEVTRQPQLEVERAPDSLDEQFAQDSSSPTDETAAMEIDLFATAALAPEPSTSLNPQELARSMKVQLCCKICLDEVVGIAFLPCGHLVCCPACAPAMLQCPLCRQEVRGTVRAFFDKL